jgi:hypothetical protein
LISLGAVVAWNKSFLIVPSDTFIHLLARLVLTAMGAFGAAVVCFVALVIRWWLVLDKDQDHQTRTGGGGV